MPTMSWPLISRASSFAMLRIARVTDLEYLTADPLAENIGNGFLTFLTSGELKFHFPKAPPFPHFNPLPFSCLLSSLAKISTKNTGPPPPRWGFPVRGGA